MSGDIVPHEVFGDDYTDSEQKDDGDIITRSDESMLIKISTPHDDDILAGVDNMGTLFKSTMSNEYHSVQKGKFSELCDDGKFGKDSHTLTMMDQNQNE